MSKVLFAPARALDFDYHVSLPAKLEELLEQVDLKRFIEVEDYVAIKMHLGSQGAFRIVRPVFIRKVVDAVRMNEGNPFVTDTVRIPGLEYLEVANANGINHLSVGAPVVLADGIFGKDVVNVPVGELLGEIGVASAIYEAQAMIVVSHCKGHMAAGYGGAIKNLGMGGIGARNRDGNPERGRMHFAQNTHLEWDMETCDFCQKCINVCPHQAINFDDRQIFLDQAKCAKCARCSRVCPSGALVAPVSDEVFQRSLAEAARAVVSTFKPGKILYINFVLDVQPECDCMPLADVPIIQEQGILISDDIVAIEMATLDLMGKAACLPDSKGEENSGKEGHILQKVTGKDPYFQVKATAELGMGQMDYELVKIERKSGKWESPFDPNPKDLVPLKPKGHGWHKKCASHPHPCQT